MDNNSKKISFSFSKTKKPPLGRNIEKSKETIEFVDCFDYSEKKKPNKDEIKQLIIPLTDSRGCQEVLEDRIEKKKESKKLLKVEEALFSASNDNCKKNFTKSVFDKKLTELAAAEILNDAQKKNEKLLESPKIITEQEKILLSTEQKSDINEIDYESVPVTDFGLAMLRGMGWKPNSGIGKNPRIISTTSPKLWPKGLGLGINKFESHYEPKS